MTQPCSSGFVPSGSLPGLPSVSSALIWVTAMILLSQSIVRFWDTQDRARGTEKLPSKQLILRDEDPSLLLYHQNHYIFKDTARNTVDIACASQLPGGYTWSPSPSKAIVYCYFRMPFQSSSLAILSQRKGLRLDKS